MSVSRRGVFYHYRFMIDGELYRGSTKETALGKARQFESLLMTKIREGAVNRQLRKAPLLSELAVSFLAFIDKATAARQLDDDTRRCYRNGWRLLSGTSVAGMRVDQIGTSDAATLRFPRGPSNGNQALRTLRRMLSYACETGVLRAAPKIKLLEEQGREAIIEPWVEDLLLEHADPVLADILSIMLDCGMRPEEVRRMRWENVLWERGAILVPHGKSLKARRFVGITERMRECLKRCEARNAAAARKAKREDPPWVFPAASGTGHRESTTKAWTETLERVNAAIGRRHLKPLPDGLVLYSARHTFATNFLAAGGELSKLMLLLGHASITTTQKYLHPSTAGAAELMNEHNRRKHGIRIVKSA